MNPFTSMTVTQLMSSRGCWRLFAIVFILFAFSAKAQDYCEPSTTSSHYFSSIEISSSVNLYSYTADEQPPGGYENLSSDTIHVVPGDSVSVNTLYVGGSNTVKIWVDWNNNGVFEESELMDENFVSSVNTLNILSFVVPTDAAGHFRMRIRGRLSTFSFGPCDEFNFSPAVDITLHSGDPAPCANAHSGTIMPNMSSCTGDAFTLETDGASFGEEGLSYQWWASKDNLNWEPLDGATSRVFTVTDGIDEARYYYLVVACSEDGSEATSGVVLVSLKDPTDCYCEPYTSGKDHLSIVEISSSFNSYLYDSYSYTATSLPTDGYKDLSSETIHVVSGGSVSVNSLFGGGVFTVKIWVDWNNNGVFEPSELMDQNYESSINAFNALSFDVPSDAIGTFRMRVRGSMGSSSFGSCYGINSGSAVDFTLHSTALDACTDANAGTIMDDFTICPAIPFTLSVTNNSSLEYGLDGQWMVSTDGGMSYEPVEGATHSTYAVVHGITEDALYYYSMTCTHDGTVDTTEPVTVTVNTNVVECYCTPVVGSEGSVYIDDFSTSGGMQNIENMSSGPSVYSDFSSSHVLVANPGSEIFFQVETALSTAGFKIWVDWNNDGVLAENEVVYVGSFYTASPSGSFFIPEDAEGEFRMRIGVSYIPFTGPQTSCELETYEGEFEDYTISTNISDCFTPTGLTVTDITQTTATFSWEGNAGGYEYAVTATNVAPGEGVSISGVNSVILTSLTDDATQFAWIRSDCGGSKSNWTYKNFTTTPFIPTCPDSLGDYENITLPYFGIELTTCGSGNSMTSTIVTSCGTGGYLNGEDKTFIFTPDVSSQYEILLTTTESWVGLKLFDGCPFLESDGECVGVAQSSTGDKTMIVSLEAGTTYYLIVDSWPEPECISSFDLSIDFYVYDCEGLGANYGDACITTEGEEGTINESCECEPLPEEEDCLIGNQFPSSTYTPSCTGEAEDITIAGWAGEYSMVHLIAEEEYTFSSSIETDWVTISDENGTEILVQGTTPLSFSPFIDGKYRFYTYADELCSSNNMLRTRSIQCPISDDFYCEDLDAYMGSSCTTTNGEPGTIDDDCNCDPIPNPCDDAIIIECGETYTTDLILDAGVWTNYTGVTFNYTGSEQVFIFTAPEDGEYEFVLDEGEYDADFFLMDGCSNEANNLTPTSYGYWTGYASSTNEIIELEGGVTYYLIADLWSLAGNSTITVTVNCLGPKTFDCEELEVNFGTSCTTVGGEIGLVDEDCNCEPLVAEDCLEGTLFPSNVFTPSCSGNLETMIAGWAGEYAMVNLTADVEYTFASSVPTDWITLSNEDGTEVWLEGSTPLNFTPTQDGIYRYYIHADPYCGTENISRVRSIQCFIEVFWDCEDLEANYGEFCTMADGETGTISEACECVSLPAPCDNIIVMECGESYTADLAPLAGYWTTYTSVSYIYAGSEQVFQFTAPANGKYEISLDQGERDADFFLMDDCSNQANNLIPTNNGYWDGGINQSSRIVEMVGGITYYIIADLYSNSPTTVTVSISCPPGPTYDCEYLKINFSDACTTADYRDGIVNEDCNCEALPSPCDDAITVACGETYTAELIPDAGEWKNYTWVSFNYTGSEQVFEFTAPYHGEYLFDLDEGEEDADFFLMKFCNNEANNLTPIGNRYWKGTGSPEAVTLVGGETYYIIADLYHFATEPTTVTLSVTCPEEPTTFDCSSMEANFGDPCITTDSQAGAIDEDCNCETQPTPCEDAIIIECGETYSANLFPNSGFWTNYTGVLINYPGSEQVFVFTAPEDGIYEFNVDQGKQNAGFILMDACSNNANNLIPTPSGYWTGSSFQSSNYMQLEGGATYYLIADYLSSTDGTAITVSINCFDLLNYDCENLDTNFGDSCTTISGEIGIVNEDCDCEPIPTPCEDVINIECGETYSADLVPVVGAWTNYPGVSWNYTGSEQVFAFSPPVNGAYEFTIDQGTTDADFFLMDDCSNEANNLIGGNGYWTGNGIPEIIELQGGATYYLIADLYALSFGSTTVTLSVNCSEVSIVFDCDDLEANIGDECENANGNTGTINGDCGCEVTGGPVFIDAGEAGTTLSTYPNPTGGLSKAVFTTGKTTHTLLEVYDVSGRNIATLFNQEAQQGMEYTIDFNGTNLPNGIYVYRLTTQNETIIEKFMIAK